MPISNIGLKNLLLKYLFLYLIAYFQMRHILHILNIGIVDFDLI